jgi:UDP-glucose 4-epimerase
MRVSRSYGSTRHRVEVEAFCNGFRQQVPETLMTVLRFPSIVGPTVDSPMTRYLRQNPTPVLMGFDPLLQLIHENDVVEALAYSIFHDVPGVFNVAAEGILPLSKILALVGRFPLPIFHPFAYWETGLRTTRIHKPELHFQIEPDYLRYSWVADITRMRTVMAFSPSYTAEELLREFAGQLRLRKYKSESPDLNYDAERLRDTLERRRRIKEKQSGGAVNPAGGEDE